MTAVVWGDLNLLRCFVGGEIRTMVLSADPGEPTLFSRHCRHPRIIANPSSDPAGALRDLELVGKELRDRPVLIYGTDAELLLISRNRDRLAEYFRFNLPPAELIEQLVNKTAFALLARKLSLPAPQTVLSTEIRSAAEIRLALPCVMKPNTHVGWFNSEMVRGEGSMPGKVLRADTPDELAAAYEKMLRFSSDFVIQEYIPGGEELIYSFHAYLNSRGEALAHFAGRKVRTYPRTAGRSTFLELVKEPELVRLGLEVLQKMNFTGVVKIDFKKDSRTGKYHLLELNPRFNLWHYLGMASGINLPRVAYDDLMGLAVEKQTEYRTDIKWLNFLTDFKAYVQSYRPDGALGFGEWLGSYRGKKVHDVFAWNDPYPAVISSWHYLKALARRLK